MQQNPLFPSNDDGSQIPDYLRTSSTTPHAQNTGWAPQPQYNEEADRKAAVDLIRQKLAALYAGEPSAEEELREVASATQPLSKHQQFMLALQQSGKSQREIQAAWHGYYAGLPDTEKHEVWQEFYAGSQAAKQSAAIPEPTPEPAYHQSIQEATREFQRSTEQIIGAPISDHDKPKLEKYKPVTVEVDDEPAYQPVRPVAKAVKQPKQKSSRKPERPSVAEIKDRIRSNVRAAALPKKSYFRSLGFGLACGAVVLVIFLFGFFNEVIISPFIQPSRQAIDTPVIVDTANSKVGDTPQVIIPKINVQIPVDYSQTTTNEADIETALEDGVVHYPTTVMPGQNGNAAFFGHSSNNIFNPGHYKFAFVLLHKLTEGDTFYLTYQGKAYVYEVISHKIVDPSDVGVLGPVDGQTATATLITCDPPGTSLHRLVVVGKQISPDPSTNGQPPASTPPPVTATTEESSQLPGNGPTLFSRLWHSIF